MSAGRGLTRVLVMVLACVLVSCSTHSVRAPVGERHSRAPQVSGAGYHIVKRGESLFSIAWQHGLDYHSVAAWNGIRPPYTIYPGQKLRLRPVTRQARPDPRAAPVQPPAARPAPPSVSRSQPAPRPEARSVPAGSGPVTWQWPVNGPVLRRFDADTSGKKGILLGGAPGTQVRAAAPGQVVYVGSGLVGYGRIIILKHNDTYLSAYGHNRNLLVNEGDVVRAGQPIAEMGNSGTNRTQLHFEIRRNGKPVDPLRYLPRR